MYDPVHVLSTKSARQRRNVFIWCTASRRVAMGWRVDNDSPITVSTAYRWVTTAVQSQDSDWEEAETYALFPVEVRPSDVLRYSVHQNGPALSRESHEIIVPGDYGLYATGDSRLYYFFPPFFSFSDMEKTVEVNSAALAAKASLTIPMIQQALNRDQRCIFSGRTPSGDSDTLVATWIFPPFLGYELEYDPWLQKKYFRDPDTCDLSKLMVVTNVVSCHQDVFALFWDNMFGVDVDDDYRIIMFESPECLQGGVPLKSHLTLVDGPLRPSDQFLRLHFARCLAVSACHGDVTEDYEEQEIENFMDELGVYDGEMDTADPRWQTPLGSEVYAHLIRQKLAEHADQNPSL